MNSRINIEKVYFHKLWNDDQGKENEAVDNYFRHLRRVYEDFKSTEELYDSGDELIKSECMSPIL